MNKCRICFKSSVDQKMTPFNDQYVSYFNLLTNLKLQLCDVTCQLLCDTCTEMFNLFVEFRNKCIQATCDLQDDMLQKDFKQEDTKEKEDYEIDQKINIKTDEHSESASLGGNLQDLENDNVIDEIFEEDVKPVPDEIVKACIKKQRKKIIVTKTSFPCGLCYKSFDDRSAMSKHVEDHKNDKTCSLCTNKFRDWQELLSHRVKHVSIKDQMCHICFKFFRTPHYLEYHYKNDHTAAEEIKLRCSNCNRSLKTPRGLKKHIHRCNTKIKFICDYCSKEFKTKHEIRIHIAVHMDRKPYVCDICQFSCKFSSNLRGHILRKHTPGRVYCKKCKQVFGSQLLCDKHKCQEKTFVCSTCGKTFSGSGQFRRHLQTHTEGRYRCDRCPSVFKSRGGLRDHRDRHDGRRSQHCEYCPRSFYSASVLIKHRRTHTGLKPYVCKICKKAFTGNNNLKVHMRVHGEYLIKKKVLNDDLNTESNFYKTIENDKKDKSNVLSNNCW